MKTKWILIESKKQKLIISNDKDFLQLCNAKTVLIRPGKNEEVLNKNTFPKLLGLDAAIEYAHALIEKAKSDLTKMDLAPEKTYLLEKLADLVIERDH